MDIRTVSALLLPLQRRTKTAWVTATIKTTREDTEMWHEATNTTKMAAEDKRQTRWETKDAKIEDKKSKSSKYQYNRR